MLGRNPPKHPRAEVPIGLSPQAPCQAVLRLGIGAADVRSFGASLLTVSAVYATVAKLAATLNRGATGQAGAPAVGHAGTKVTPRLADAAVGVLRRPAVFVAVVKAAARLAGAAIRMRGLPAVFPAVVEVAARLAGATVGVRGAPAVHGAVAKATARLTAATIAIGHGPAVGVAAAKAARPSGKGRRVVVELIDTAASVWRRCRSPGGRRCSIPIHDCIRLQRSRGLRRWQQVWLGRQRQRLGLGVPLCHALKRRDC